MFGCISFFPRAPRRGRPPAPPLSKLEKLEDSQPPHLSPSAGFLRDHRGDVEMAAAAESQTVAGRRRRGGSADPSNINTHGQMEAESHASVLASTDPSVHALKPKRMHENINRFSRA